MSFKDILGQERPVGILKSYIEQDRLDGSHLFSGPQGVGKMLVAKALAKAVNCLNAEADSCDACVSCLKIEKNEHPDVFIIDYNTPIPSDSAGDERADSDALKIGHIRQLQRNIALRPYEGRKKVFIIDAAHNLTVAASNALLKILEEPVKESVIILITHKPFLLFKTVASRCRRLKFSGMARPELKSLIKKNYGLDNDAAHFLAYFYEGRQGAGALIKDADLLRRKNAVVDRLALSARANFEGIDTKKRQEVRNYLNILAAWFRDIYLLKSGAGIEEMINYDRRQELLNQAGRYSFEELQNIFASISDSIFYLERNINTRLLLLNLGALVWKD